MKWKEKHPKLANFLTNKAPHLIEKIGDTIVKANGKELAKQIVENDLHLSPENKKQLLQILEKVILNIVIKPK